jgi:hypothetical protein
MIKKKLYLRQSFFEEHYGILENLDHRFRRVIDPERTRLAQFLLDIHNNAHL